MSVLFLSCWYPTEENPLKGIFVREHARAIHASGKKIVVLALNITQGTTFYQKRIEKFSDEQGIETHIIHIRSLFYKWIYINPFRLYSILHTYYKKEILSEFNPDIIHSNILNPCAILGDWLATEHKKPHVITEHWSKVDKYMERNILSYFGKRAYGNAMAITTVSQFLRSRIEKYVSDASKIKVVPNVIDAEMFCFAPKAQSPDRIVFSCIASWVPPKQPVLFVKALQELSRTISKKIELNMVGEGPLLNEISALKVGYTVNYPGKVSRTKIAELLQGSDYFLHASDIETFSMVCAEALSTGTPVIASNVGGIPELVNDSNGVLTENSVPAWTRAIHKAIDATYDNPGISKGMSGRFSRATVGQMFRDVYSSFQRV